MSHLMRTLRDARPADAAVLCAAERDIAASCEGLLVSEPDELREEAFRDRIAAAAHGSGKYLVAENDAAVVAHASLWPMTLRRVSHVLRLDMCVHAGHWRRGHGRALLEALLAWARAHPAAGKIELLVRSENLPALALYRACGFVEEGRLRQHVRLPDGRCLDDIAMGLILHEGPPAS